MKFFFISVFFFCFHHLAVASSDSIPEVQIEEVVLSAVRNGNTALGFRSDTLMDIDLFQPAIKTLINRQPGISAWNGENFAQDIRISIRGFGARSAFGIRGIRMLMDGIPLTAPDGTTQPDELSIFDIGSLEIVRSAMSARLGNAAGGVVALKSPEYFNGWVGRASVTSFGSLMAGAQYGIANNKYRGFTSFSHNAFKGKRVYAASASTSVYHKSSIFLNDKWHVGILGGLYDSPIGNDPGALTKKEFDENPYQANARNRSFLAGESVRGGMAAVQSTYAWTPDVLWTMNAYYRKRDFEARLPFVAGGWVQLDRDFTGITNAVDMGRNAAFYFSAGNTVEFQNDRRRLSENQNGLQGRLSADQFERVLNVAFFQQARYNIKNVTIQQMLRWDNNIFTLSDQFASNGIQDGRRRMNGLNASLGFSWDLATKWQVFSNISSHFETPTLNELTNNPGGSTGFNAALDPEKSWQGETGFRYQDEKWGDLSLQVFALKITDQIQGYELPETPGRQYYRNAVSTTRYGLEAAYSVQINPSIQFFTNYAWSRFQYSDYLDNSGIDFGGNSQPLIPVHKLNAGYIQNFSDLVNVHILWNYTSGMFLDDANISYSDALQEVQLSLATGTKFSTTWRFGIMVNNALNTLKYSNFRVNAAGGRYFEAASPFHMGINLTVYL